MSPAHKKAVYTVQYCLNSLLKTASKQRGYDLQQESYSRWAARELIIRLEKDQETPPLILIEKFRDQMNEFSCVNPSTSYIFSCAKDMAEWIIDLLIA